MPDPDFKTVSASQVPELLNISQWGSRLTLHHQFANRIPDDRAETRRMKIGKLFEPMILEEVAKMLVLEVHANPAGTYTRHPTLPLGCTEDARVLCPTRGPGVVEVKAVDKYEFQRSWTEAGGPKMYEAQLQTAMLVKEATWGILAPFVYNEGADGRLVLYERRPHAEAQERIGAEATAFFADLAAGKEPTPFGIPVELGLMNTLHPEAIETKVLDATDDIELTEMLRMYQWTSEQHRGFGRARVEMLPKLLARFGDHGRVRLAEGVSARIRKPVTAGKVIALPADIRRELAAVHGFLVDMKSFDDRIQRLADAVDRARYWHEILRQPGIQNRIVVQEGEAAAADEVPEEDEPLTNLEAG